MRFFLLALALLPLPALAAPTPIAAPSSYIGLGASGVLTSGNLPAMIPTAGANSVIDLYAGDYNAAQTAGNFYPFYLSGIAYQVPSTQSAVCFQIFQNIGATAQIDPFQLVSATATFAFNAASITGGKHQCGAAGKYCLTGSAVIGQNFLVEGGYTFAASSWAGFQPGVNQAMVIHLRCIVQ